MGDDEKAVNILMVDDQRANLLALEAVLESLGQNLVRANSGEEALRQVIQNDFAVILMDVMMPGMNGIETAELIRKRDRSKHTPVIFLTAGGKSETEMFQGYAVGAIDYLLKPIRPAVLRSKVLVLMNLYRKTEEVHRLNEVIDHLNAMLKTESEIRLKNEDQLHLAEESIKNLNADLEMKTVERIAVEETPAGARP
jgi:CheY-like chemotaxis protein